MEIQWVLWFTFATACVLLRESDGAQALDTDSCLGPECLVETGSKKKGRGGPGVNAYRYDFTDPLWRHQWYLHDYRSGPGPVVGLNVVQAHRMGYTGKGVRVAVVDTGVDAGHPDVTIIHQVHSNRRVTGWHGTLAAGMITMTPNNTHCGVGIAYHATVIDINAGGFTETDSSLAQILRKEMEITDLYSNSWGPQDDGKAMKLRRFTLNAIKIGATMGRHGKGCVYVFAGGNGKELGDNCGADDLVNSPYAIGVAGATRAGKVTSYGERCSALLATAYSGDGGARGGGLVTMTPGGGCTRNFWGTSAAAPVASAIVALTLQANPDMTYRDVMHVITMSAEVAPLADNVHTWNLNGAGFWVSNDFGFGLLNAKSMVNIAVTWDNVPPQRHCTIDVNFDAPKLLNVAVEVEAFVTNDGCKNNPDHAVGVIEQFQMSLKATYSYRGALEVAVTTARGTNITIMEIRPRDTRTSGISQNWAFKSVHAWGENPYGKWIVKLKVVLCNDGKYTCPSVNRPWLTKFLKQLNECTRDGVKNVWKGFALKMFGTQHQPPHASSWPRTYSVFHLPDQSLGRA